MKHHAMTKEQWIEKRVAEGFTKEQAIHEYDNYTDPAIAKAQEQKVLTKGEQIQQIGEAISNNPDKSKVYRPDFSISAKYVEMANKDTSSMGRYDLEKHQRAMIGIKLHGTISSEELQAVMDKALDMQISKVIEEMKKYEAIISDTEKKIDNFDLSIVQKKIDDLTAEYEKKAKSARGNGSGLGHLQEEYDRKVDALEMEYDIKPLNDLKIKRWEADEYRRIYDAVLKKYISENRDLIEAEIEEAKRREVRENLASIVAYVED